MIELAQDQFHVARDLARPTPLTVEARAVIGGGNPGCVFIDRLARPRVGLVWAQGMEGFYLLGEIPPPDFALTLSRFIASDLAGRLKSAGHSWFEISAVNPQCDDILRIALAHHQLRHDVQWIYRARAHKIRSHSSGGSVPVDEAFKLVDADGLVHLRSTILRFWNTVDGLNNRGLGRCRIVDGVVVSLCFSGFVDGAVHAVHVETLPAYRRQGHAMSVASDFLGDCLERGYTAHWDCMATNEASWRLAERMGLERVAEYRCHSFKL